MHIMLQNLIHSNETINFSDITRYCRNAFSDRIILTQIQLNIVGGMMAFISPLIVTVNFTLAYTMYKIKSLNSRSRWYIFLLTLSDGFYGITSVPLISMLFLKYGNKVFCELEYATIFLMQLNMNISLYLVLLIALHRYLKIHPELKSRNYKGIKKSAMSGRIGNFLVAMCYVLPLAHAICSTNAFGQTFGLSLPNMIMKLVDFSMFFVVFSLYGKLCRRFVQRQDKVLDVDQNRSIFRQRRRYRRKVMKTVLLILTAQAICFAPFLVFDLWTSWYSFYKKIKAPQMIRFSYFLSLFFMASFCISDAIIFIYRNTEIKEYIYNRMGTKKKNNTKAEHPGEKMNRIQACTYKKNQEDTHL